MDNPDIIRRRYLADLGKATKDDLPELQVAILIEIAVQLATQNTLLAELTPK